MQTDGMILMRSTERTQMEDEEKYKELNCCSATEEDINSQYYVDD